MRQIAFVFAGVLASVVAFGLDKEVISGKVITVIDGNTVEVAGEDNETYTIMLHGIDCPELGQDFGTAAKEYLEKMLMDKPVSVEVKGKNRYGVRQGIIMIDNEVDPRMELLKEGLAWTAEVNPLAELETLRVKAQDTGKGLWKKGDATPPWVFRRLQTRSQFKSS